MILMLAAAAATMPPAEARRALTAAPPPVRDFIERRAGCNHWGGEEPYDAERGREIAAAVRDLRCTRLDRDERALRRRYARRPDLLRLLDATADADGAV